MLSRLACGALGFVAFVLACGDDAQDAAPAGSTGVQAGSEASSSGGSDNDEPTMEAAVDVADACGADTAETLSFVATRVACVKPPPSPCTLPDPPKTYAGTALDCSNAGAEATLQVSVDQTGRYHVETVLVLVDGTEVRECYGEGGDESEVIIDDARLANRPTLVLTAMGRPCE